MSGQESWTPTPSNETEKPPPPTFSRSGYDLLTGIYHSLHQLREDYQIPTRHDLSISAYVMSQFPHPHDACSKLALIDAARGQSLTYAQLDRAIRALAVGLYHGLGVRKGDVVFVLSPNSILFPTICLAIFSIGAIVSPANPVNTELEIMNQVRDSGAKVIISAPEMAHKVMRSGVPLMVTTRVTNQDFVSVEELIECCDPAELPRVLILQSDTAAIMYSSGMTGVSKGVVLNHSNFIAVITILKWSAYATSSQDDVFLCFIPMFHIYGLVLFALGRLCARVTTVVMQRYAFQAMLDAIEKYKVNNLPTVPPVILGLVKHASRVKCDLSSVRRVGSSAAPLSKELIDAFRDRFPWMTLRQGYGLTESCAATSLFVSEEQAKVYPSSCGQLVPTFTAKAVDIETGLALPPGTQGKLWLKGPTIMTRYLRNDEATAAAFDSEGWLKTGDLAYFNEEGFLYIVDRIKELIKHNGYRVAPAELESILLSHPLILDAAVIPVEDEETGQIPMAYVVRASGSELTEEQVIRFVANQVAPYKKVRKVAFINGIPRSAAGKVLRKQLVSLNQQCRVVSKL